MRVCLSKINQAVVSKTEWIHRDQSPQGCQEIAAIIQPFRDADLSMDYGNGDRKVAEDTRVISQNNSKESSD